MKVVVPGKINIKVFLFNLFSFCVLLFGSIHAQNKLFSNTLSVQCALKGSIAGEVYYIRLLKNWKYIDVL